MTDTATTPTWEGTPLNTGTLVPIDNATVLLHPDGYLHVAFNDDAGSFEFETHEKLMAFFRLVYPGRPGAAVWIIRQTRPGRQIKRASKTLDPEDFGLSFVATVVGPVGAMIMNFFRLVLKTPITIDVHTNEQAGVEAVLANQRATGHKGYWAKSEE